MPVIRTPDGRRLRVPDNATTADIQAVIASLPPATPEQKQEWQPKKRGLAEIQAEGAASGATGLGTPMQNFAAGAGETFVNTGRKGEKLGRQLGAYLGILDDQSAELERLDEETRKARKRDAPLLDTTAGQAGQIAGDIGQAIGITALTGGAGGAVLGGARALPGVARGASAVGRALPTATRAITSAPARAIALDATAGGVQGALQDTTSDESTLDNATKNALFGAILPGAAAARRPLGRLAEATGVASAARAAGYTAGAVPVLGAPVRGAMIAGSNRANAVAQEFRNALSARNTIASEMKQAHRPVVRAAEQAAKQQQRTLEAASKARHASETERVTQIATRASKRALDTIGRSYSVKVTPQLAKNIKSFKASNSALIKKYPDLERSLDNLTIQGGKMPGSTAQMIKAKVGAVARDRNTPAEFRQGLHEVERLVTNSLYDNLPAKRAKALRQAFDLYGKAASGKLKLPPPKPVTVTPNIPELVLPPMPIEDALRPYSRNRWQGLGTAAGRGALMPREEYEE